MQQSLLLLLLLVAAARGQVGRQQLVKSLSALVSQARGAEDFESAEDEDFEDFEDFDDFDYAYDFDSGEEEERRGKQLPGLPGPGLLPLEECETAGFERRQREECQEVIFTACIKTFFDLQPFPFQVPSLECNMVNVTKYRTEIVNKCKSIVDRECHVVDEQVPKEECVPSQRKVCHIAIRIEDEEIFDEVCNTHVKNICADPYHKAAYPSSPSYPEPPLPSPYLPKPPEKLPYPAPTKASPYKMTPTPRPPPYHFTPTPYPPPPPSYPTPRLPNPYLSALGRRRRHIPSPTIPTPPGCHSVVSQDCHKVPKIVKNQVIYSSILL